MRKFLVIGVIIVLTGIAVNYMLGGFSKVKSSQVEIDNIVLFGHPYEGRYSSDSLDNLITFLQNQIITTDTTGSLVIVNFLQDELEKRGVVKQFVGILWNNPPKTNLVLDTLHLPEGKAIQFSIPVNPLVMPSPEKLKKMAMDEADQMGVDLSGYSIEQYRDKQLIVLFPLE